MLESEWSLASAFPRLLFFVDFGALVATLEMDTSKQRNIVKHRVDFAARQEDIDG